MFRSGTTLLARMLQAHSKACCAVDPYIPLFKEFRNDVASNLVPGYTVDPEAPLDDYYYYPEKQSVLKAIQQTSFDLTKDQSEMPNLRKRIAHFLRPISPKIEPFLDQLNGCNYVELIDSGFDIVQKAYGQTTSHTVGFKVTWAGEFANHILESFPEAKVIHVMRDPRAICASKNSQQSVQEKYPWLFLIRQWRKLATLAWQSVYKSPNTSDRVLLLKYEQLVSDPEMEAKKVCDFLNMNFDPSMIDPNTFVDGTGSKWSQNSSYQNFQATRSFNLDSIDRWKNALTSPEIQFIEHLCYPEMEIFGYQPDIASTSRVPLSLMFDSPEVDVKDLATWIRPYSQVNGESKVSDISLELLRSSILHSSQPVPDSIQKAFFLDTDFFEVIRQSVSISNRELASK